MKNVNTNFVFVFCFLFDLRENVGSPRNRGFSKSENYQSRAFCGDTYTFSGIILKMNATDSPKMSSECEKYCEMLFSIIECSMLFVGCDLFHFFACIAIRYLAE